MARIKLKGNPINTTGELPAVGAPAPSFTLTASNLTEVSMYDFKGKRIVMNIFTSMDQTVCAASIRRFNQEAASRDNLVVACISADLPFAAARFCSAEGIKNVTTLSTFRDPNFGNDYGVRIIDGHLAGLMARAVVVIDEEGKVVYTEQVPENTQEPDYEAALKFVDPVGA